ncbi:MAG TPA: hypothetical protein VEW93_05185 [Acidimicrobiales bacterium]|nr:hypothetical protein [Acidimicrobiales bacterium]
MITTPHEPTEGPVPPAPPSPAAVTLGMGTAALASLGAGAIHAAAIGVHSEHRPATLAFTVVAALQVAWGAAALARPRGGRLLLAAGAAIHLGALGGWLLAKTVGIGFVDGLDVSESVQLADGAAAALAVVAVALAGRELVTTGVPRRPGRAARPARGPRLALLALPVAALSVAAMVSAGSHSHAGGHGDEAAADHPHGDAADHADGDHAEGDHPAGDQPEGDHPEGAHGASAAVAPTPYDPALPLDLSGVEGVTPEQQARAENLIAITLIRLPHFADVATAEAAGFKSIGDGFTGHEHYIHWDYLSDGRTLDPDHPEALVYDTSGGGKRLVSAMFMAEPGVTLDTVPEVGGPLTQWHIHDDLCFTPGDHPRVVGVTEVGGTCEAPLQKFTPVPMIHVWIESHRCGPFAALEGVGAGQIEEGEERLCDHAHGA